jgi:hypothetical protein
MEDLLERTTVAHDHLAQLADPTQQERLSAELLRLSHVDLVQSSGDSEFVGLTYNPVPTSEHTTEQSAHHDRVTGMMDEAARLTSLAVKQLESAPPEPGFPFGPPEASQVFQTAKHIALGEAIEAQAKGDHVGTRRALQNVLVVKLLQPSWDHEDKDEREVIARGMGGDLLAAVGDMRGVVAIDPDGHGLSDTASRLSNSADLIRLATNTDFDERFEHPQPLLRAGLPAKDVERRSELIENLDYSQLTALARLMANQKHNPSQAAYLSEKAIRRLTQPEYGSRRTDAGDVAQTIASAVDYAKQARNPTYESEVQTSLSRLRELRLAGLKPYRVNSQITYTLDEAMVNLTQAGHLDAVRALLSCSRHEISNPDTNIDESRNFNFDRVIEGTSSMSAEQKQLVLNQLRQLHAEKVGQFRSQLQQHGATDSTIDSIIYYSSDPDSALDVSPEFWGIYQQLIDAGRSPDHTTAQGAMRVRELIEGPQTSNLGQKASAIKSLLDGGLSPAQIGESLVGNLDKIHDDAAKDEYTRQLREVAQVVGAYAKEHQFFQAEQTLTSLSGFREPRRALQLAQKMYDDMNNVYMMSRILEPSGYHRREQLQEIDPETQRILEYVADHAPNAQVLFQNEYFTREHLLKSNYDDIVTMVNAVQQSPALQQLSQYADNHQLESCLLGSSSIETLASQLAEVYTSSGLREILATFASSPNTLRQLTGFIFAGDDAVKRATELTETFQQPEMQDILTNFPDQADFIITMLGQYYFRPERAQEIARGLHTEGIMELREYVGPAAADTLLTAIIGHKNPQERAEQILHLFESLDFLQEARVDLDYGGHVDDWMEFIESIPDGAAGETMKRQIVSRLKLGIGEDATQAIRIFSEVSADNDLINEMRARGFALIQELYAADSLRGFPSAKPTKLAEIFFDTELGEIYQELYSLKQAGDVEAMTALMSKHGFQLGSHEIPLVDLVQGIRTGVEDLNQQSRSAKLWLKQFSGQTIPAVKLIEAWKSRKFALKYGVKDNPTDILRFVAERGVQLYADQAIDAGRTDVTAEEFTSQQPIVTHIGSRYSPRVVFEALERKIHFERQNGSYPAKLFRSHPAANFTVGSRTFSAEVLGSDDPRGFTIGFDTGCCMTLGGASESCIWAGYEDPRYSFFAVYDNAGRLRAQSILYLAQSGDQKILVADNIETNAGTDLSVIADLYRDALTKFATDQELELDAIHIGVGYTPSEVIRSLPQASVMPGTPKAGVYTDARDQRVLWSKAA